MVPNSSYKVIIAEKQSQFSYSNNSLIIKYKDNTSISCSLDDLYSLVIDSMSITMTSSLLQALSDAGIPVLFTDRRHLPASILLPYNNHFQSAGIIERQIHWTSKVKETIWTKIVRNKILCQARNLNKSDCSMLMALSKQITANDDTNREALSAKYYFPCLFGKAFVRFEDDDINHLLNYGYSILLSAVCKNIAGYGYLLPLGIHHCCKTNPYNLACDLMEPFRPLIDREIIQKHLVTLNQESKITLSGILDENIKLKDKTYSLRDGINEYVRIVLKSLSTNSTKYCEVTY